MREQKPDLSTLAKTCCVKLSTLFAQNISNLTSEMLCSKLDIVRLKRDNRQLVGTLDEASGWFYYNAPGFMFVAALQDIVPLARLKEREPRYEYEWMISYRI